MPESPQADHCASAEIFDDLEGRTSAARRRTLRKHLAECAPCKQLYAKISALHADAISCDARHVHPERLVTLADRASAGANREEQDHLKACGLCRAQLAELTALPQPAGISEPCGQRLRPWTWRPRLAWGLAAAAALLLFVIAPWEALRAPEDPSADFAALAQIEPIEIAAARDIGGQGGFDARYRAGLQGYVAGDYATARRELRAAAELDPQHAVTALLLGSAALLEGESQAAIRWLGQAAQSAPDPAIRAEALWQLANAHLTLGEVATARTLCEEISSLALLHDADARKVLAALNASKDE